MFVLLSLVAVPAYANETKASSSSSSQQPLDISPLDQGRINAGMQKAGNDLSSFGESISIPIFFVSLILAIVLLVCGVFSRKALAAGGISLLVSVLSLLILGDVKKMLDIINYLTETFRNYF